jgi:hypothetical protein
VGVNVSPKRRKVFCKAAGGSSPLVKIALPSRLVDAPERGGGDQRIEAARNRRRGIDEADRPGGKAFDLVRDKRKMRAGEHDLVRAPAVALNEARCDLALDLSVLDGFAAQDALGDNGKQRRADQGHLAIGGIVAHQRLRVVARHRPARRQHADQSRSRRRRRGLDRRHGADEGEARMGAPQRGQSERGGGAAGDDDNVGLGFADQPRHHRLDPSDERLLAEPTVREGRVIGGIDDFNVRPEAPDFGQHRKAAQSGIEHQRPWGAWRRRRTGVEFGDQTRGRVSAPTPAVHGRGHTRIRPMRQSDQLGIDRP